MPRLVKVLFLPVCGSSFTAYIDRPPSLDGMHAWISNAITQCRVIDIVRIAGKIDEFNPTRRAECSMICDDEALLQSTPVKNDIATQYYQRGREASDSVICGNAVIIDIDVNDPWWDQVQDQDAIIEENNHEKEEQRSTSTSM